MSPNGCTCRECVEMCRTYSCLPTPKEAKALIAAGYGNRMMLDTRRHPMENGLLILALLPAMKGHEGGISPMRLGPVCVFLEDDLCILHDLGLKPLEGRFCVHDTTSREMHEMMARLRAQWATPNGRATAEAWVERYFRGDPRELRRIRSRTMR